MKKILAVLLVVVLFAPMTVMAFTPFGDAYPSSQKTFNIEAPADGVLMIGEVVGGEESLLGGWSSSGERDPDTAAAAAFTGHHDRDDRAGGPFFDPMFANDPSDWCGLAMPEPYVLTEIRLLPRDDQLGRFEGASIWGFNGGAFDPSTATLIYESDDGAWDWEFQIIKPDGFVAGSNAGFTHFAYFNDRQHGDIMEIEFYGNPLNPPVVEEEAPVEAPAEEVPVVVPEAPPVVVPEPAPQTADMHIVIALAVLVITAFVTIKLTRQKNRV